MKKKIEYGPLIPDLTYAGREIPSYVVWNMGRWEFDRIARKCPEDQLAVGEAMLIPGVIYKRPVANARKEGA